MKSYKYIVLGAGPSGLSFAHTLLAMGEDSVLVLEKHAVAGGLCRSETVDGSPLDIGGGHFLDVKDQEVLDFLFQFLPADEWQRHARISKINIRGREIDYPLEANLWQLPTSDQVEFLESISKAGCTRGIPAPESFEEWISWKLGERIAEEYMLPYNRKIWSTPLAELGTYWLEKLPNVSFRDTLRSCLERKPAGTLPAHAAFLYPKKYGYGEVWRRMGNSLGEHLLTSTPVTSVDIAHGIVNGAFKAERIFSTIPWSEWPGIAPVPAAINDRISTLQRVSIDVDYFPGLLPTKAHWVYECDESIPYHRVLCRSNFCRQSTGYWTETNTRRSTGDKNGFRYHNEYAYPINTRRKPESIAEIGEWAKKNRITGLGRWGRWEHMNSDVAVSLGIAAAKEALRDTA